MSALACVAMILLAPRLRLSAAPAPPVRIAVAAEEAA